MTKETLLERLAEHFTDALINIEDQSHLHRGHPEQKASGGGHFSVQIVSEAFSGVSSVERHRMVYGVLDLANNSGIHALSVQALTPSEKQGKKA